MIVVLVVSMQIWHGKLIKVTQELLPDLCFFCHGRWNEFKPFCQYINLVICCQYINLVICKFFVWEVFNVFFLTVIVIVERFWRLTFLRSLRLLVASRFAFKICFLAPCLWWSQRIHMCTFELLYSQRLLIFPSYCWTGRFVPGGQQQFVLLPRSLHHCFQLAPRTLVLS